MSEPAAAVFTPSLDEPVPVRRQGPGVLAYLLFGVTVAAFSGFLWSALLRPADQMLVKADPEPYRTEEKVSEAAPKPTAIDALIERAVDAAPQVKAAAAAAPPAPIPAAPPPKPIEAAPAPAKALAPEALSFPNARFTAAPPLKPGPPPAPSEAPLSAEAPPPPPVAEAAPKPAPKPAVARNGRHAVQLGALANEGAAAALRRELLAKRKGALAGLDLRIERGEAGGAVVYRLRAYGLADPAAAKALCEELSAAGQACMVVRG